MKNIGIMWYALCVGKLVSCHYGGIIRFMYVFLMCQ